MAVSRKQEERALSADEWKLVQSSHHPAVQKLSDAELRDLLKTVRERRDRAQSEAHRKRREIRGKVLLLDTGRDAPYRIFLRDSHRVRPREPRASSAFGTVTRTSSLPARASAAT